MTTVVYCLCFGTFCLSAIVKNKNDMSLHQYSESGEVVQVSYASKAVEKSSIGLIGFSEQEYSVVFAVQKKPSTLQVRTKQLLIEKYSRTLGMALSGYSADNEYVRSKCNLLKQTHILRFGETPLINSIAKSVSRYLTRGMYIGDKDTVLRPVATAILFFGRDFSDSAHRLTMVENSGSIKQCSFITLGNIPGGPFAIEKIRKRVQTAEKDLTNAARSDYNVKDAKEGLRRRIIDVATILFDAAESSPSETTETDDNPNTEYAKYSQNRENNAEKRSEIDIECSICDSSGLFFTDSFSSTEKLLRLLNDEWLGDE